MPVHLAIHLLHFATELAVQLGDVSARHAVAAIHRDPHRACQLDVGDDTRDVFRADVALLVTAAAVRQVVLFDARAQLLDGVTG